MRGLALVLLLAGPMAGASRFGFIAQLPGNGKSSVTGMARDGEGNFLLVGSTTSSDLSAQGFQKQLSGSNLYRLAGTQITPLRPPLSGATSCLAADQLFPGTVYAWIDSSLLQSVDAGANWQNIGGSLPRTQYCGAMAAAGKLIVILFPYDGAYRSTDGGGTWTKRGQLTTDTVSGLVLDPFDPNHQFALSYRSGAVTEDGGLQWFTTQFAFIALSFDRKRQGVVFGVSQQSHAALRSGDGGRTWNAVTLLPGTSEPADLAVDPNRPGTVYASNSSALYRSRDDGQTWEIVAGAENTIRLAIGADSSLYAGSPFGILCSFNEGQTWSRVDLSYSSGAWQHLVVGPDPVNGGGASLVYVAAMEESDGYVAKYSPDGQLRWVTYLGGPGFDAVRAVAVDSDGSVYVTGDTTSATFPLTDGSLRPPPQAILLTGGTFVSKISADGQRLIYSALMEGGGREWKSIAVDSAGAAWVISSTLENLPRARAAAVRPAIGFPPPVNSFAARLAPDGSSRDFVAALDADPPQTNVLALDGQGNAWTAGRRLWKIDSNGNVSGGIDVGAVSVTALAADSNGDLLVAGIADPARFVASPDALQKYAGGYGFVFPPFAARVNSETGTVTRSTFLQGDGGTTTTVSIGEDTAGKVLIGGSVGGMSLPTRQPVQGPFHSVVTGFAGRLSADLSAADVLTYCGDTRPFQVTGAASGVSGEIVFAGQTLLPDGYRPSEVFLAQLLADPPAGDLRLDAVLNAGSRQAVPVASGEVVALSGDSFREDARVLFDEDAAEIAFRNWKEIRAIVPPAVSARSTTLVRVEAGGQMSSAILMPVAAASPGLYTSSGQGWTFALAWQDDGTPVLPERPVAPDTAVTIAVNGVPPSAAVTLYANSEPVPIESYHWGDKGELRNVLFLRFVTPTPPFFLPLYIWVAVDGDAIPARPIPLAVTGR